MIIMFKLTKSMEKSIKSIKKDTLNLFKEINPGSHIFIVQKPTKKKVFRAKIINVKKPFFLLFINNKLFASYLYENEEWKEELESIPKFS